MTTVESLGLERTDPEGTYLVGDGYQEVWIGLKWDVARKTDGRFDVWRKGHYVLTVGSLDLACAIVADDCGTGSEEARADDIEG